MEQVIKNNLDQWYAQWLAIEHPKDISAIDKLEEYQRWRDVWTFWYQAPYLDFSQMLAAYKMNSEI